MSEDQQNQKEKGRDDEPAIDQENTSANREDAREQCHHNLQKSRIFGIEVDRFIELCFACIVTAFTALLWWTSSDQLDAMKKQTAAMQAQLDLSQRPWIEPEHESSIRLILDKGRWNATVGSVLKNHGESVALNIGGWAEMFPIHEDSQFGPAKARQQQWCDANRHPDPGFVTGAILFPKATQPMPTIVGIDQKDISSKTIGLAIVGCVHYRSSYDRPEQPTRQTRFSYLLSINGNSVTMGIPRSTDPTTFYLVRIPALWSAD